MRRIGWGGIAVALCCLVAAGQEEKEPATVLEGHLGGVTTMTFSADGRRFASGAGDGIVRVWDVKSGPLAKLDELRGISVLGITCSPNGKIIAACGKGKAGFWTDTDQKAPRVEGAVPLKKGKGPGFAVPGKTDEARFKWASFPSIDSDATYSDLAITGDAKDIYFVRRHAGLNYPGRVLRYDIHRDVTEERPGPKHLDPRSVACIADPESGSAAVYGNLEKEEPAILIYGLGDTRIVTRGVPPIVKEVIPRIAYSPDGRWLAAWSGRLAVWPVPGSQLIGGEPAIVPSVYAAAVGPRDLLATVPPPSELHHSDITLWKLQSGEIHYRVLGVKLSRSGVEVRKLVTFPSGLKDVSYLAFSPDGRWLAVGGGTDGVILLKDMQSK